MPPSPDRILVLGGGLAGLQAALHLADAGHRPVLLEAAKQLGGRARSWFDTACAEELDNGPHLLMGAYTHTLRLLTRLGSRPYLLEERTPRFTFWDPTHGWQPLVCPDWPAPWHLLAALARFTPLARRDIWNALRLCPPLLQTGHAHQQRLEQQSVSQWLQHHRQSDALCQRVWYPLCLATLNEPAGSANAALFATVLRKLFLGNRHAVRPLLPTRPLAQLFALPAQRAIQQAGGEIHCQCRVQGMEFVGQTLVAVHTNQGSWHTPRAVIAALPHTALHRLLPASCAERPTIHLQDAPIVSVHLTYPHPASLPVAMVGLPGATSQWLLDRNRLRAREEEPLPQQGRFSAVLSGAYREQHWPAAQLIAHVHQDLLGLLPALAPHRPCAARVIKERHATFAAWPGSSAARPDCQTPWRNLWLAGDWTRTGLPATLEGACHSGLLAAQKILDFLGHER
ncbi:MAG: hydroxysqualene dehydroxylase HpnE [Magnetococcus sp. MYC-9]